jgi:lysophospholipase L1-like esterase
MKEKKGLLTNLAVLAVTVIVFAVMLELFFRAFYPQPTYAVEYAPWGWKHISGVSFIHGSERGREFVTKIKYNSKGLRDYREFPYEKPKNTYRIEVYGDSYAEGVEVPYEKNLCKLLEDKLNANLSIPGTKYEVMNFGVYAYDTAQEYLYFKYEGVKYSPDLVIVLYTTDDPQNLQRGFMALGTDDMLKENLATVSDKQKFIRLVRGYVKSHFHFLTFLINRSNFMSPGAFVKDGKKIALVHDLPYRSGDEDLDSMLSGANWSLTSAIFKAFKVTADSIGSKVLIVSSHIDPAKFGKRIEDRQKLCDENGISFLVSYDFGPDRMKYHYPIDGHWNAGGHVRMADLIYDKIINDKLLQER